MKTIILMITMFALAACGGETPNAPTASTTPPEATQEAVETASVDSAESTVVVEYIWHKKADGFTEEDLWSHAEYWANDTAEAGDELNLAVVMTPRVENDNADFIWVLVWPTGEARDSAWANWAENREPAWLELTQNTFTYSKDNVYGFTPLSYRMASVDNDTDTGISEFIFCTYREGMGAADRLAFEGLHNAFTDAYEADAAPTSYWWAIMDPLFEPDPSNAFDYMWVNFFANDGERDGIYAAYVESEHSSQAEQDADCTDPSVYDSKVIFRAEAVVEAEAEAEA